MLIKYLKNDKRTWLLIFVVVFCFNMGMIANKWPNEFPVFTTGISSVLAIVMFSRILPPLEERTDRSIFLWLCSIGIVMNTVVRIVNEGYMPVYGITRTVEFWVPMNGAKLIWMGDWLFCGHSIFSIGDVLLIIGAFWAIYSLLKWRFRNVKITC